MSLTGAIVSYYDSGFDAAIVSLRYEVGENKMWADQAPSFDPDNYPVAMPYIVLVDLGDNPESEGKDLSYRLDLATIQFSVFATTRQQAEEILDLIEEAYLPVILDVAVRDQVGVPKRGQRLTLKDPAESVWHGFVELTYRLEHTY